MPKSHNSPYNMRNLMEIDTSNDRTNTHDHLIHRDLCPNNFWDDNCSDDDCELLHIRRNGHKLLLFDGLCHLNRLQRKTRTNLSQMKLPINTELYINDSCVDPEDWGQPITFNNPNIFVARSIGIHPNTLGTRTFFEEAIHDIHTIAQKHQLASIGLIGRTTTSNDPHYNYQIKDFVEMIQSLPNQHNLPIYIKSDSMDNDNHIHKALFKSKLDSPIIWQTINRSDGARFDHFADNLLSKHHQYHLSIDGRLFEESAIAKNKLYRIFSNYTMLHKRMILETGAPHNLPKYSRNQNNRLYPLHIADIVVELYYCLRKSPSYANHTLADINELIVSNGFNMFPRSCFHTINTNAFKLATNNTLAKTFKKHESTINYDSPNLTSSNRNTKIQPSIQQYTTPTVGAGTRGTISVTTTNKQPSNQNKIPKPSLLSTPVKQTPTTANYIPLSTPIPRFIYQKNKKTGTPTNSPLSNLTNTTKPSTSTKTTDPTIPPNNHPGSTPTHSTNSLTTSTPFNNQTNSTPLTPNNENTVSPIPTKSKPKPKPTLNNSLRKNQRKALAKKTHRCINGLYKAQATLNKLIQDTLKDSTNTSDTTASDSSTTSSIIITDSIPGSSMSGQDDRFLSPELVDAMLKQE